MTKEKVIEELLCMKHFVRAESDADKALDMAIEALKTEELKFTQVTIETDVPWLERQLDMYKEKIYLNEQTMIVYVPFVTAELVEASVGTFKRVGEEE